MPARDWEEDVLEPHPPRNTRRDQGPKQLTALLTHRASSPSSKHRRTTAENRRRSRKTPTFFAMSEASLAPRAPPVAELTQSRVETPSDLSKGSALRRKRTHSPLVRSGCRLQVCRQRVARHPTLHEENRSRSSRCRIFSLPKGLTRRRIRSRMRSLEAKSAAQLNRQARKAQGGTNHHKKEKPHERGSCQRSLGGDKAVEENIDGLGVSNATSP